MGGGGGTSRHAMPDCFFFDTTFALSPLPCIETILLSLSRVRNEKREAWPFCFQIQLSKSSATVAKSCFCIKSRSPSKAPLLLYLYTTRGRCGLESGLMVRKKSSSFFV